MVEMIAYILYLCFLCKCAYPSPLIVMVWSTVGFFKNVHIELSYLYPSPLSHVNLVHSVGEEEGKYRERN